MALTPQQRRNIVRARLKMIKDGTANRLDPIEIRPYRPVGASDPTPTTGKEDAAVRAPTDAPLIMQFPLQSGPDRKT
ncbi:MULTISPECIES: hypothetical protein [Metallibacterium]|jgi:hypothetical protein|uniref:hypothetical protein n=1 Tax=Metallibacterium TaxID=1218803 RepID=UPI0026050E82|nr:MULTISPECIES: hypothetical protein [Metallibacterium]MBW8075767.1 hypothetical protein [Metallibacterium scheffleri]